MNGFSVRYGRFENKKKTGEKKRHDFFCHREGFLEGKVVDYSKKQRNRGSSRCGCKAHMRIKLKRINEIFLEEWQVVEFVAEHNHVLLSTKEKFCLLMGKPPQTILMDQDPWMSEAIAQEMSTTKHAFCIWHITTKFSGWFNSLLRSEYSSWCSEFYNLYKLDTVEEFEQQWPLVIAKYNLNDNKHVVGFYEIRELWVPAYLRGFFFGGMTTTGKSKSINAFIKRFISSRTCLNQFVRQEQGHHYLTPYAFKKFQHEFGKAFQYSIHEENCTTFIVNHHKATRHHTVFWDGNVATCSCKYFEFVGILCRHILSVFVHKDCFEIPSTYWLSRWRRKDQLQDTSPLDQEATLMDSTPLNNSQLGPLSTDLVQRPPKSTPKGRPKKIRPNGGNEFTKQVRRCSLCKSTGHYISNCPEKENITDRGIAQ
ncbi:protein FAR1-RELATED SEQUENCE 11 [Artemisia annua]|uniref:Protein FAR1-RELATED SEQUENCE n=1 Tax=Artemisia annua TaxID=35608 RepID=A0A2U1NSN3_ARTAN|nr:protein FAR1-RELATED SEQUENCE 11 [Artemisia annua]